MSVTEKEQQEDTQQQGNQPQPEIETVTPDTEKVIPETDLPEEQQGSGKEKTEQD